MNHIKNIAKELHNLGLDAMLVTSEPGEFYAMGFHGEGVAFITPQECWYYTDSRYIEAANQEITGAHVDVLRSGQSYRQLVMSLVATHNVKKLGFEDEGMNVHQYKLWQEALPGVELVPASDLLTRLRMVKDEEELAVMREAQRITDEAFTEILNYVKPGVTESEIAVYYAHGDIVGTRIEGLGSTELIVAPDVVADLDRLASDDRVKAVVLRINSGGGSAYASEQMWRAVQLLKQRKPVVVSMGGTAASGAYYLACGAHCIYAEPTSLTGSIGIFGMIPDASGLLTDKLGLHFDVVKTNEASDFGTVGRPFNAAEGAAMQAYVDRGYALFLRRVAAGRGMKPQQVDSIAQGRVWTGRQAKAIGLVDYLGSLSDAVTHAALRAKTDDYTVKAYPARRPWYADMWADRGEGYFEQELRAALGSYYRPLVFLKSLQGTDCLQARLPYELNLH